MANVVNGVLKVFSEEATAELLKEVKETFHIHGCDEAGELVTIAKAILKQGGGRSIARARKMISPRRL